MGERRQGRIAAMQILYQLDAQGSYDQLEQAISRHFAHVGEEASPPVREFAAELCRGVVARWDELDQLLQRASDNWRLERMSRVDRNVLRLGCYELQSGQVPPNVVIDEAVEIGLAFGTSSSGSFINGVLNRVASWG